MSRKVYLAGYRLNLHVDVDYEIYENRENRFYVLVIRAVASCIFAEIFRFTIYVVVIAGFVLAEIFLVTFNVILDAGFIFAEILRFTIYVVVVTFIKMRVRCIALFGRNHLL